MKALKSESLYAIRNWFGISENVVTLMRKAFGVNYTTTGTQAAKSLRRGTYSTKGHYQPRKKAK